MAKTYNYYDLSELQGSNAGIIIRTQQGTEISIAVEDGKTLILFPFGNLLLEPEAVGHLSAGVAALPMPRNQEDADLHRGLSMVQR